MSANVQELQGKLNQRRDELAAIFEKAKTVVDGEDRYNLTPAQLEDVKSRNTEIDDLATQVEEAKTVDAIYQANAKAIQDGNRAASNLPTNRGAQKGEGQQPPQQVKSLGELFVNSQAYQEAKSSGRIKQIEAAFEKFDYLAVKTLMTTAAGFGPETTRTGRVALTALRRPVIADLMPNTPYDQAAAVYMEETTFTNNAAAAAEGNAGGEAALAYTERNQPMREIKTWLPVTEVQLEDVASLRSLIDNRLLTMLDLAEEAQLMTGDGNAPNLEGFLVKSGVQSQAKGGDPVPDAIYKAITKIRHTGFAEPSAVVMHPNDWEPIRLLRTTDGIYIWGSPAEAGPERVWGLPAVITTAATENTGLLGDFLLYSEIFRRRGATIKVSDSHSDYFIKNILAMRADKRLALAIYRATAFCKVTGI
jgi:HK97 family phage major capsid protein